MPRGRSTRQRRWGRRVLVGAVMVMLAAIPVLSYLWFVAPPTTPIDEVQPADAVVLFVGSPERLETAVELMDRGIARYLVLPNGRTVDRGEDLCDNAPFQVLCPTTDTVDTLGEASAIAALADEMGWSRLVAVTSVYHVHRATFLLSRCHEGPVEAVAPAADLDRDDWVDAILHEWGGLLVAMLRPGC